MKTRRTTQQNKALHKFFELQAQQLNDAGYTVKLVLERTPELDWTPQLLKELLWRRIQKKKFGKQSTADIDSGELQMVYDELNRFLSTEFFIHTPFPSLEVMVEQLGKVEPDDEYEGEPDFNK